MIHYICTGGGQLVILLFIYRAVSMVAGEIGVCGD